MNSVATFQLPQPFFGSPTSIKSTGGSPAAVEVLEKGQSQFQKACNLYDNPNAQFIDLENAVELFKAAAEFGHAGAMARLVLIYTDRMNSTCVGLSSDHLEALFYKNMAIASLTTSNNNAQLILNQLSPHLLRKQENEPFNQELIIESLVTTCRKYLNNDKIKNLLPTELWLSIIEQWLPAADRRNLARTCKTFAFLEGSADTLPVTLYFSLLNKDNEAEFRQYLQMRCGTLHVQIKMDRGEKKWFQIFCDEVSKNENIRNIKLDLHFTFFENADLVHLAKLTKLQSLKLDRTLITDQGLGNLSLLTNLRELGLHCTKITDEGLVNLAPLINLRALDLYAANVTDKGLGNLALLINLRHLNLIATKVTDEGLENLAQLINLRDLRLMGTKVTDKGLIKLAPLINLRHLNLSYTKVTDAGLPDLALLKHLAILFLEKPEDLPTTGRGYQFLKEQLPDLEILPYSPLDQVD
ncbi:MAG: hypothetical protein K0R08_794 [Solimicrobium sp.]|jgi:hypothetical protein|nr:hypothetical protein [Solimicrobium sp.]